MIELWRYRTVTALNYSALINFAKFREESLEDYAVHTEQVVPSRTMQEIIWLCKKSSILVIVILIIRTGCSEGAQAQPGSNKGPNTWGSRAIKVKNHNGFHRKIKNYVEQCVAFIHIFKDIWLRSTFLIPACFKIQLTDRKGGTRTCRSKKTVGRKHAMH